MTVEEFSNEFDILYNSIMSNQAPGLDEYEKSVFLTKALNEILKSYFDPRLNKSLVGFDGNEKRQIDFSNSIMTVSYKQYTIKEIPESTVSAAPMSINPEVSELDDLVSQFPHIHWLLGTMDNPNGLIAVWRKIDDYTIGVSNRGYINAIKQVIDNDKYYKVKDESREYIFSDFKPALSDDKPNTKAAPMPDEALIILNEYVIVNRGSEKTRLTVVPLSYTEYNRLNLKPYNRPLKRQAWRIICNDRSFSGFEAKSTEDNTRVVSFNEPTNMVELIVGTNDDILGYTVRYIKRPSPIILESLVDTELSIEETKVKSECELDPILHQEILLRAVELAKSAYMGDLNSTIALGQTSHTNIGVVTSSRE